MIAVWRVPGAGSCRSRAVLRDVGDAAALGGSAAVSFRSLCCLKKSSTEESAAQCGGFEEVVLS